MQRRSCDRVEALADEVRRRRHHDRLPARHGRQQPVRRGHAHRVRRPRRLPAASSCMDTTDEAAITARWRRLDPARTLFLVASKSGGTIEAGLDGEVVLGAHVGGARRSGGTALRRRHRSGHGARAPGAKQRGYRKIFLNPPDIGGRFSALSLFGLVPGALIGAPVRELLCRRRRHGGGLPAGEPQERRARARRVHRRSGARRARQADGRAARRRSARSACGSSSSSPRAPASTARARCRSSTSRSGRPTTTDSDRAFVAISTDRDAPDAARLDALEARRPSGAAPEHADRRARRRVLPLGVRDGGRGRGARHQSVRRAERVGSEGEDQGDPGEGDFTGGTPVASGGRRVGVLRRASRADAGRGRARRDRRRSGRATTSRSCRTCRRTPAIETAVARHPRGDPRAKRTASTFGVGPRYLHSTGQYHKGGPNTCVAFVHHGRGRDRDADSRRAVHVRAAEARAGGRRFQTLEAHDRRTVRIHLDRGVDPEAVVRVGCSTSSPELMAQTA